MTRKEVGQKLVDAEENGSELVSNASYPDVARIYTNQVAQARQGASAYGGVAAGSSARSARVAIGGSHEACVGPVSFCTIYAGSCWPHGRRVHAPPEPRFFLSCFSEDAS